MLTIIHGDDTAASRNFYINQKLQYQETIVLDGDKVSITELIQIFESGGLFSDTKTVFIEQFFTKKKKDSDFPKILEYLQKYAQENNIFLWEAKQLEKGIIISLKNISLKTFNLPQTLFIFLDNIKPGNGQILIKFFHKTIETTETEMVFFMIIRQFRLLLSLSEKSLAEIDEVKKLSWQKSKLEKQALLFNKDKILKIYKKLFEIEIGQKTGTLSLSLISTIDFLLLGI
jgi:hypothetical protein